MINYPNKKTPYENKSVKNNANQGMALEEMISISNNYYKFHNIAYVNKRPVEIKVLKTEDKYKIKDGYFMSPSTLDFVGVCNGKYLDFDAKETISATGFPMANIATHQIESMEFIMTHQGITFAIIFMKKYNEIYLLEGKHLIEASKQNKKYISYDTLKQNGYLIKEGYNNPVDYIKVLKENNLL